TAALCQPAGVVCRGIRQPGATPGQTLIHKPMPFVHKTVDNFLIKRELSTVLLVKLFFSAILLAPPNHPQNNKR
ncbi:MAG: hypothetical protein ACRCZU_07800, partial [Selenomonadaceae bacterium]